MDISLGKVGSQSATWAERTGNTRIDIFTARSDMPNVLTRAVVVQGSVLLHALSLRQLVRRWKRGVPRRETA